jgi:hypothetical protein
LRSQFREQASSKIPEFLVALCGKPVRDLALFLKERDAYRAQEDEALEVYSTPNTPIFHTENQGHEYTQAKGDHLAISPFGEPFLAAACLQCS